MINPYPLSEVFSFSLQR